MLFYLCLRFPPDPPYAMFALIVLFTIFLGLVALLAVTEQWQQRRRRRKAHSLETNLTQLTAWLEDRGHTLPSVAVVTGLLNRVARREIQSEVRIIFPPPPPPSLSPSPSLTPTKWSHTRFLVVMTVLLLPGLPDMLSG